MARRGTDKRQRGYKLTVRFNAMEAEALRKRSESSGIPMGALARSGALNAPLPRAARRPTIEQKAVAQLLGQIATFATEIKRIGVNINQTQKHINAGHPQWNVWEQAMRAYIEASDRILPELRTACMEALGRERATGETDGPTLH